MATQEKLEKCAESLKRVQNFVATTLGRENDLGTQMSFVEVIDDVQSILDVYKRIPISALQDFTDSQFDVLIRQADADFNVFEQISKFSLAAPNAVQTRLTLMANLKTRRDQLFDQVFNFIAYGVARVSDTSVLESQARATIQSIKDESKKLIELLDKNKTDSDAALTAIRSVASEQGVSQQAIYFKDESESQNGLAEKWLKKTYLFAFVVAAFAVLSIFIHKIPFLKPDGAIESLQLVTSKMLIFATLGYLLILAAKNYNMHKHNAIVNKHRQNALLTYRALVAAADGDGTEDIVLAHAASCIFSPQETGFSQNRGDGASKSVLELFTKSTTKTGE